MKPMLKIFFGLANEDMNVFNKIRDYLLSSIYKHNIYLIPQPDYLSHLNHKDLHELIDDADLYVFLFSKNLNQDFVCKNITIPIALENERKSNKGIIPILLDNSDFHLSQLKEFEPIILHEDGKTFKESALHKELNQLKSILINLKKEIKDRSEKITNSPLFELKDWKKLKWGFLNKDGETVIDYRYDEVILPFKNGKARVRIGDDEFNIDSKGNKI